MTLTLTRRALTIACLALGALSAANAGGQFATKDEAQAMVKKAVAYYKANGQEKLLSEINNRSPQFVDRDLYLYVVNIKDGKGLAHGANTKLVGKDLSDLKDSDGKSFWQEILALARAGKTGWVEYKWPNPVTKEVSRKAAYTEPVDGMAICAGAYIQ